jgi:hypothetical protein
VGLKKDIERGQATLDRITDAEQFATLADDLDVLESEQRAREARRDLAVLERDKGDEKQHRARERRRYEHEDRARDLGTVREKLRNSLVGHAAQAAGIVRGRVSTRLSDDNYAKYTGHVRAVASEYELERKLAKLQKREVKAAKAYVEHEPRVYRIDSPHSYFRDLAVRTLDEQASECAEADERLARYEAELSHEIARQSKEGRRARQLVREVTRNEDEDTHRRVFGELRRSELRAVTTGSGATASAASGFASFVSPYFIIQDWAPFRGIYRSFADQCHSWPVPDWGMQLYIPRISTTTTASAQTEGSAVSESPPSTALEGAELKTVSGQVVITTQLHDRGFTGGGSFDSVIGRQLHQQLDQEVDLYTLNQAITNGESVTGASEYKTKNLYEDIAKGREKLTDTAGTRLRPTHFFTTSDIYSFATRQVDATTERPIVEARFVPGFPLVTGADDGPWGDKPRPAWSRFTGTVLPGGVLWMTDDNIAPVGTTNRTRLIVSAPDQAIVLAEGTPILSSFVETLAGSLEVVVNLRSYAAAITRHAAGTAAISSAAYTTALV